MPAKKKAATPKAGDVAHGIMVWPNDNTGQPKEFWGARGMLVNHRGDLSLTVAKAPVQNGYGNIDTLAIFRTGSWRRCERITGVWTTRGTITQP